MDNSREKAHRKCGASGCHAGAVNESRGTGQCSLCHSEQSLLSGLVSGGGSSGRSSGKHKPVDDTLGNLLEGSDAPRKKKKRHKRNSLRDLVN